ncbi:MAG: ATP-binding cassette domain-containing protein [Clostridia bacterium]|nr:ATP-binding cassette domain-containing protein [Clostridia bacterium]
MLQLKDIRKDYYVADTTVQALKGVSLSFRRNEFVSVLGASGCGKTTLLNIIGGLDHYTSGDLVIEGTSTKDYSDGDWDTYRNHRIGFVFQNYNLISHQTVLGNVELALTLSGVSKKERRERAEEALKRVGLGEEIYKKPNQLSGGQMQRVAIARALVNEPEILLADEPTGALDTKTSVQIMDLIKEIAGERLVIMVTHNPDLAKQYSTRIVELKDGVVIGDSNPYSPEEEEAEVADFKAGGGAKVYGESKTIALTGSGFGNKAGSVLVGGKPAKIIYWSDTRVDVIPPENVYGRQNITLTDAAGKVNNGVCDLPYAASYAKAETGETSSAGAKPKYKKRQSSMSYRTAFALSGRNLLTKKGRTLITSIAGSIGIISVCLVLALSSGFNNYIKTTEEDMLSYYPVTISESSLDLTTVMSSFSGSTTNVELDEIDDKVYVNSFLTSLANGLTVTNDITQDGFLEYLEDMPAKYYNAISYDYGENISSNLFTSIDISLSSVGTSYDITQSMSLSAIKSYYTTLLTSSNSGYEGLVGYVDLFGEVVNTMPGTSSRNISSETFGDYVLSQYDEVAGEFKTEGEEAVNQVILVVGSDNDVTDLTLAQLGLLSQSDFLSLFSTDDTVASLEMSEVLGKKYTLYYNNAIYTENASYDASSESGYAYDYVNQSSTLLGQSLSAAGFDTYGWKDGLTASDDEGIELEITCVLRLKDGLSYGCLSDGLNITEKLMENYVAACESQTGGIVDYLKSLPSSDISQFKRAAYTLSADMASYTSASEALRAVGGNSTPYNISLYAKDFDTKEDMLAYLDAWNEKASAALEEWIASGKTSLSYTGATEIKYADTVGTLMSMVDMILNAITYVLVAFTAISLVVSTVMIGVITYVSVVERTKEIGILRSIGARKKDIRHVFNAETFIIGLISGLIGVGVAYLLQIVINLILTPLTGISGLAALPVLDAVIMVIISVVLTFISGTIPASAAAKKDPVVCLRSE